MIYYRINVFRVTFVYILLSIAVLHLQIINWEDLRPYNHSERTLFTLAFQKKKKNLKWNIRTSAVCCWKQSSPSLIPYIFSSPIRDTTASSSEDRGSTLLSPQHVGFLSRLTLTALFFVFLLTSSHFFLISSTFLYTIDVAFTEFWTSNHADFIFLFVKVSLNCEKVCLIDTEPSLWKHPPPLVKNFAFSFCHFRSSSFFPTGF